MPPHDDEHDHGHDHADGVEDEEFDELDDEDDIVVLVDAEGTETEYHMLGLVEVEEDTFAMLSPAIEEDEESDSMEVVLMRYDEDEDGGMIFSDIENEELFKQVQAAAEQFFKEMMAEEDEA